MIRAARAGRPVEDVGNVGQALGDEELDRLYGLPLGEFTAARDALAKDLRGAGDAEGAKRVKELRKPTRSAGAINRAVRGRRKEARELLDAAEGLRKAQERMLEGGGREAVDEAAERERAAVDRFMDAVESELDAEGGASSAMLDRARATLHALPGDDELRDEFAAGRITEDHEAVGFGGLSVGAPPRGGSRRRTAKGRSTGRRKQPRPPERAAVSTGEREARRRLKRAERDLEIGKRRLRRAKERAATAQEQLDSANVAVGEAEEAVAGATKARDAAAKGAGGG